MVSFHASGHLPTSKMIQDCEDSSKKRKHDGSLQPQYFLDDPPLSKTKYSKRSVLDTELHLETPMPLEWQRCLDIQSGQIYYYNSRTHKKTSTDPGSRPKNMSLDLELSLPCGSSDTPKKHHVDENFSRYKTSSTTSDKHNGGGGGGDGGAPSWLALEGGDQQQEMMAVVCKKCHMLVMMFKISPTCPNCKFMHPVPNQSPPSLLNRELSLLC